jgi:RNA-directed DNA polymerase
LRSGPPSVAGADHCLARANWGCDSCNCKRRRRISRRPAGGACRGYCTDTNRHGRHPVVLFDFLGYTFRPRFTAWPNGKYGVAFLPVASHDALKAMRQTVRRWSLQRRTDKALDDLTRMSNPYIRGWINYYSHFYKSALYASLRRIYFHPRTWVRHKFKRFRQTPKGAREWLARVIRTNPGLFAHWPLLYDQRLNTVSRMN